MLTFLFWNINNKNLNETIYHLVDLHQIDILVFAEFSDSYISDLLKKLNWNSSDFFFITNTGCDKIHIFVNFSNKLVNTILESDHVTIKEIALPGKDNIILAASHLISKLSFSDMSQSLEMVRLSEMIIDVEKTLGHTRTILIGDLNSNPFEAGIISSKGLNAVMCKNIANKLHRKVQGIDYPFFYNPMWSLLGDKENPPGTYYYEKSEHFIYNWNIFDQILIRPSLIKYFKNNNVKIITTDGHNSFITRNGIPNKQKYSDHLPIIFSLDL